jgi:hypothetical protein
MFPNKLGVMLSGEIDVNALLGEAGANEAGKPLHAIDNLVKGYGAGTVNILTNLLVYVAVGGLIIGCIALIVHGNNVSKRAEESSGLIWKIGGAVLGFAAAGIVILAQTIGTGLVG